MSRKKADFLQLITYINKGKERENTAIFHNLKTDPDDINIIAQEFQENSTYSPKRKNGVECYHEILSFSGKSSGNILPDKGGRGLKISPEILEDLAREYLQLRSPDALAYGKLHRDTDHPHIHFCISGNLIKQRQKNRLSRAEFGKVKTQLKEYFRGKYPELAELDLQPSITPQKTPQNQKKSRLVTSPQKQRGQTIKAELAEKILRIFSAAKNHPEAMSILSGSGIDTYHRGKDALYGVIYQGKKYRLSTLGIKEKIKDRVAIWKQTEKRLRELELITQSKEKMREIYPSPTGRD